MSITAQPHTDELAGLVAAVTGGASGIGAACAQALAARGARVGILDLDPRGAPTGALAVGADVADDASVKSGVEEIATSLGGLDILVNCAGIGAQGSVESGDLEFWHRVYDVNVLGIVRTTRAALPYLRTSGAAAIVNVGSIAATAGLPQRALYCASKGAVHALTRAMAADHGPEGIRVNCVAPGTADTPWVRRLLEASADPEAELAALSARQPHGRLVSADEVGHAVAYLASPLAGSTNGATIAVDGGMADLRLRPPTATQS